MKRLFATTLLALLGSLFWGCDQNARLDVQTFTLEHRSGYEAAELVHPYVFGDREGSPGSLSATSNALSIRETRDNLEKIARVLEEFDQPVPGLWLRFQLIEADSFQDTDPAIAEVVDELENLFRFDGYRLVGEAVVSVAGGFLADDQGFEQRFLGTNEDFMVHGRAVVVRPGSVRLDPVELWQADEGDRLLQTSVNVTPGQTVVIGGGRARIGGRAFILTVTAETN